MNKYTVIHTIRFSKQQSESLHKLKEYDVKAKESPRVFNRWMNLVNNFDKIFGSLK